MSFKVSISTANNPLPTLLVHTLSIAVISLSAETVGGISPFEYKGLCPAASEYTKVLNACATCLLYVCVFQSWR